MAVGAIVAVGTGVSVGRFVEVGFLLLSLVAVGDTVGAGVTVAV